MFVKQFLPHWPVGLLFLTAPALIFPSPLTTPALLSVPMVVAWGLLPQWGGRRTPLDGVLLTLAMLVGATVWVTADLSFSLGKIAGMLLGIAAFYAMARETSATQGAIQAGLFVYLMLGLGMTAVGVLSVSWVVKFPALAPVLARLPDRLLNLPGAVEGLNPNELAGVLLWVTPLAWALCLGLWRRLRWLNRLGLLIVALTLSSALAATQSRSALIGLSGSGLLISWFAFQRPIWRLSLLLLTVTLFAGSIWWWQASTPSLPATAPEDSEGVSVNLDLPDTLEARFEIWSRAVAIAQDYPWTGVGLNNFRRAMPLLYPLFTIASDRALGHAHNEFLQATVELGWLGGVALIALHALVGVMLWQVVQLPSRPTLRVIAFGLFWSLSAHLFFGLTDAVALGAKPGVLLWLGLGLSVGVWAQATRPTPSVSSLAPSEL